MSLARLLIEYLLLPALLATAWDFAVITKEDIEFFVDGRSVGHGYGYLKDLSVGAYDPVRGYFYVSDANHPNASIFRVDTLRTSDTDPSAISFQPIVSKQSSVQGIAYDPATFTLFWTTGIGNTIAKLTVPENATRSTVHNPGEVVHAFKDGSVPRGIAVDSCRQKLYWTNIKFGDATIEMSAMNGNDRIAIASKKLTLGIKVVQPYSVTVDQHSKQVYWCDAMEGTSFQIVRSDLDGRNAVVVLSHTGQEPYGLSVVGDQLYWTDSHQGNLMSLSKNVKNSVAPVEPTFVMKFGQLKKPDGVVSNKLYLDVDPVECTALAPLIPKIKKLYNRESAILSRSKTDRDGIVSCGNCSYDYVDQCLNDGVFKDDGCKCALGYTGTRCEISVCHNYCVEGSCLVNELGLPMCQCPKGRSGVRCDVDVCRDACFNDGLCSVNDGGKATCECAFGYVGRRCEFVSNVIEKVCRAYCEVSQSVAVSSLTTVHDFKSAVENLSLWSQHVCSCPEIQLSAVSDNYEVMRDEVDDTDKERPISSKLSGGRNIVVIVMLAILCVLLGVLVVFLTDKVLKLRKRPRIKKRIVVNRPQAPFCRPTEPREQCEITIENCCNMNICDTPCFEPEFRLSRPTFSKKKSEDKKTLITSMHSNSSQEDDNY